MKTTHKEADVIMVQQVVMAEDTKRCITVVCDDIYVFVLLVHYYLMKGLECNVYMDGTSSREMLLTLLQQQSSTETLYQNFLQSWMRYRLILVGHWKRHCSQHPWKGHRASSSRLWRIYE